MIRPHKPAMIRPSHLATIRGSERRACIILEDACCRMTRDLTTELLNLPEIQASGLFRSWALDISNILARRSREIHRIDQSGDADLYEAGVCKVVDLSEPHLNRLRTQMQADLVQRVGWEHIRRCTLISTMGGLLDICSRMHTMLGGTAWRYPQARQALAMIDKRCEAELLNDTEPDASVSRQRFEEMFRAMAANVVEVFGREDWREEVVV